MRTSRRIAIIAPCTTYYSLHTSSPAFSRWRRWSSRSSRLKVAACIGGVGWVFVIAMTGVSVTAFALAILRFTMADAQHPNARAIGFFLFYVATLTAAGVSTGVRALRFKVRTAPHRNAWDLGISAANVAMGLATLVYGVIDHRMLFIVFSFVGLITGTGQLRYWLRTPTTHLHWWFAHMGGMLGSCIAALTALVVVNAAWFGTRTFATAIWIAVPALGIPAIFAWTAYYRRRFARSQAGLPA